MGTKYSQFAAASQFFLYGKKHFTKTGWERHSKGYEQPDFLFREDLDLSSRVALITGANSGVGKEVATFLAKRGATVYMLCRSRTRAEAARDEIAAVTGSSKLHILEGDVSVEMDVRRCWAEFASQEKRLDVLMCNAGALLNEKVLTSEGLETTFAAHLLFGTYLLGKLAMDSLHATADSRLVVVSSGGMYNSAFPDWEVASSTSTDPKVKYDGQFAYIYAKRGQVLLCERWASEYPQLKVVSCHPGWTMTPGVTSAFGDSQSYLEPLRTAWQGAEGIVWLCVAPGNQIESGAFYLDRQPQVKHMAGPFFTEGTATKNSKESVDTMMANLEAWTSGKKPNLMEKAKAMRCCTDATEMPLQAMDRPIDLERFMGRWYVVANIPSVFDKGTVNNVEEYSYDAGKKQISVNFFYSNAELTKSSCIKQRATIANEHSTQWKLSALIGIYLPVPVPYLIVDCADDYSSTIIGVPDRSLIWLMTRVPHPEPEVVEALTMKAQELGYDIGKLISVRQEWSKGELPLIQEAVDGSAIEA